MGDLINRLSAGKLINTSPSGSYSTPTDSLAAIITMAKKESAIADTLTDDDTAEYEEAESDIDPKAISTVLGLIDFTLNKKEVNYLIKQLQNP